MVGAGDDSSPLYILLLCCTVLVINRHSNKHHSLSWVMWFYNLNSDTTMLITIHLHIRQYSTATTVLHKDWEQGPTSSLHPQFAPSFSCRCSSARSSFLFFLVASFVSYKHDIIMMADITILSLLHCHVNLS